MRHIEAVIDKLQVAISNYIKRQGEKVNYRVYWRIYHGWHHGKTRSKDRVLFERFVATATAKTVRNISFSSDFELSGRLSCNSKRSPIVDTVRTDSDTGKLKQKMVDTLLVCDLLHLARARDSTLLMVIASDDDFVPALHAAEAWNARAVMLHDRDSLNAFLSLDGIASRMSFE